MTNLTPNSSFSVTLRLQIPNRVGMLQRSPKLLLPVAVISYNRFDEQTRQVSIRDLNVDAASTEHARQLCKLLKLSLILN